MLNETIRLLLQRWRLVVLAVAAAAGVAVASWNLVPPQFRSEAQVLFLPPTQQAGIDGRTNPFLFFGASLGITADIVRIGVSDDGSRADLVARGALLDYTVSPYLAENGGPILVVTSLGVDGARTQRTVRLVADEIRADLQAAQVQAKAPTASRISSTVLTSTAQATPVYETRIRASAAAGVLTLALLLALVIVAERWRNRRGRDGAAAEAAGVRPVVASSARGGDGVPGARGPTGGRQVGADGDRVPASRS